MSIGRVGAWRLDGEGVADKHAYLFFDGKRLFVQSVLQDTPAIADGKPLPLEWTELQPPCEIELGAARLHCAREANAGASVAPKRSAVPAGGARHGRLGRDPYRPHRGDGCEEDGADAAPLSAGGGRVAVGFGQLPGGEPADAVRSSRDCESAFVVGQPPHGESAHGLRQPLPDG
jgi:hypothetical protein